MNVYQCNFLEFGFIIANVHHFATVFKHKKLVTEHC